MPWGSDPVYDPAQAAQPQQPLTTPAAPPTSGVSFSAPPVQQPAAPPVAPPGAPPIPTMDLSGIAPDIPVQRESGGRSWVGYTSPDTLKKQGSFTDLYSAPIDDSGAPIWAGDDGPQGKSHAFGPAQIQPDTWRPIAKKLGITDWRAPGAYVAVANELRKEQGLKPWDLTTQRRGFGNDPVMSAGTWKPSETGVRMEMDAPDTTVYGGSLTDYMLLNDLDAAAVDPKKRARLDKSLNKGDEVETPPEIEVKVKDGKAYVVDQDGLQRMTAAADAGVNFAPIAFKGIKPGQKVDTIVTPSGKEIPFNLTAYPRPHEAPKAPSTAQSFGMGVADVGVGAGQLAAHLGAVTPTAGMPEFGIATPDATQPLVSTADVDRAVAEREAAYERGRAAAGETGTDWARLAGNVVGTIPLAYAMPGGAAGGAARVGQAMLGGAAGSALAPVTNPNENYLAQKESQIGAGMLTGGVLGGVGEVASRVWSPYIQPAARRLMDAGVNMLTPGMMRGGAVKGIENKLSSLIPTMAGATRRAVESFNKAAYNKVLGRIGEQYEGTEVGYKGIEQVEKQLGRAYDKVLAKVQFTVTPKFVSDLQNLRALAQELPEGEASRFEAILNNRVLKRMPTGTMDGRTFKEAESELSGVSRQLHRSQGPYAAGEHQLGDAVDTLNGMLRENIEDQNPKVAADLRAVNGAWAAFVAMRKAAANRGTSLGVFTPSDLLTGTKRAAGERVFARGQGLMQDLAADAQEVIPNTYPDSGTAGRLMAAAMVGEVGRMLHPGTLIPMVAGSAAYTRPGNALMQVIAGRGLPAVRNALSNITRQSASRLAPATGLSYSLPPPPPQGYQP